MAKDIPTGAPRVFTAGQTWEWDDTFGDFPASDGWELTYYFRSLSATDSDLTAAFDDQITANGDTFEVRIPFADTGLAAGAYDLVGEITDGTKKHLVYNRRVKILQAPGTAGSQSHARAMLAAIEARMQSRVLTAEERSWKIGEKSLEYASDDELRSAHAHWKYMVALEDNPNPRIQHAARFVG